MKLAWLRWKIGNEAPPGIHSKEDTPSQISEDRSFLSPWQFRLRFTEEVDRSTRYERPLSLISIRVDEEDGLLIDGWLRKSTRALDAICRETVNHYYVLLPETDVKSASGLAKRLLRNFRHISVTITGIPADDGRFKEEAVSIFAMESRSVA